RAQWIVGERSQVDYRVEACDVVWPKVANVTIPAGHIGGRTKDAWFEPSGIHADDLVSLGDQHRRKHAANIPVGSRDHDPHLCLLQFQLLEFCAGKAVTGLLDVDDSHANAASSLSQTGSVVSRRSHTANRPLLSHDLWKSNSAQSSPI